MLFLYVLLFCVSVSFFIITLFLGLSLLTGLVEEMTYEDWFFEKFISIIQTFVTMTLTLFGLLMFGGVVSYSIICLVKMLGVSNE